MPAKVNKVLDSARISIYFIEKFLLKRVSYLHRTATTVYPCCIPTLGDLTGASRIRLTRCKSTSFF